MASLMEELISVLGAEQEIYEKLIPISEKKTLILIKEDLEELKKLAEGAGMNTSFGNGGIERLSNGEVRINIEDITKYGYEVKGRTMYSDTSNVYDVKTDNTNQNP